MAPLCPWQTLEKLKDLYTQTEDEIEMTGGQAAKIPVVRPDSPATVQQTTTTAQVAAAKPSSTVASKR